MARLLSVLHALAVPLGGPGGAAPVPVRNAVHQITSGYKPGLLLTLMLITSSRTTLYSSVEAITVAASVRSSSDLSDQNVKCAGVKLMTLYLNVNATSSSAVTAILRFILI